MCKILILWIQISKSSSTSNKALNSYCGIFSPPEELSRFTKGINPANSLQSEGYPIHLTVGYVHLRCKKNTQKKNTRVRKKNYNR